MFEVFIANPELPLMDRLNAFRSRFQRMTSASHAQHPKRRSPVVRAYGFSKLGPCLPKYSTDRPRQLWSVLCPSHSRVKIFYDGGVKLKNSHIFGAPAADPGSLVTPRPSSIRRRTLSCR